MTDPYFDISACFRENKNPHVQCQGPVPFFIADHYNIFLYPFKNSWFNLRAGGKRSFMPFLLFGCHGIHPHLFGDSPHLDQSILHLAIAIPCRIIRHDMECSLVAFHPVIHEYLIEKLFNMCVYLIESQ